MNQAKQLRCLWSACGLTGQKVMRETPNEDPTGSVGLSRERFYGLLKRGDANDYSRVLLGIQRAASVAGVPTSTVNILSSVLVPDLYEGP